MRKIKSNFFISLDGVVEAPDKWHFPYFDDEMGEAVGAGFANRDGTPNEQLPTTAARMRLAEQDSGTRMELRFAFESREHMEQLRRVGAFEVFAQSVGQMDALL